MREELKTELERFKARYPVDPAVRGRIAKPPVDFIGEEVLDLAVAALLQGENILLCGEKATGKNILADNLAWLFGRPSYNISFHVNTDSSTLIGTDTFTGGEVRLRRLLLADAPGASEEDVKRCVGLFLDLNEKAINGEISTRPVDMRGMVAALRMMTDGMDAKDAIALGITNKCFDEYEHQLVQDVVMTRFV